MAQQQENFGDDGDEGYYPDDGDDDSKNRNINPRKDSEENKNDDNDDNNNNNNNNNNNDAMRSDYELAKALQEQIYAEGDYTPSYQPPYRSSYQPPYRSQYQPPYRPAYQPYRSSYNPSSSHVPFQRSYNPPPSPAPYLVHRSQQQQQPIQKYRRLSNEKNKNNQSKKPSNQVIRTTHKGRRRLTVTRDYNTVTATAPPVNDQQSMVQERFQWRTVERCRREMGLFHRGPDSNPNALSIQTKVIFQQRKNKKLTSIQNMPTITPDLWYDLYLTGQCKLLTINSEFYGM